MMEPTRDAAEYFAVSVRGTWLISSAISFTKGPSIISVLF